MSGTDVFCGPVLIDSLLRLPQWKADFSSGYPLNTTALRQARGSSLGWRIGGQPPFTRGNRHSPALGGSGRRDSQWS